MANDTPTLSMRSLTLSPFEACDADEQYRAWLQDEDVIKYLSVARQDRSEDTLQNYVAGTLANPNHHYFKIIDRNSGHKIGTMSLHIDRGQNIADFGYLIGDKNYWGGETAIEAQVALFDFAFVTLKLRKLHGGAALTNVGSNFNYRKLGFTREGVRRQHVLVGTGDGVVDDIVEWGCLAEEWGEIRNKFDHLREA